MTANPNRWMIARWAAAVTVLLIPVVAMQFRSGVAWSASDFVIAGILLFGSLGAYEIISRLRTEAAYRTGLAVGIGATVLLLWVNGAVGITDGSADAWYLAIAAVGAVGALVARFRPRGMAWAMWTAAAGMALISSVALVAGVVPRFNSPFEILGITAFFVVLFGGSAMLFQEAARAESQGASAERTEVI